MTAKEKAKFRAAITGFEKKLLRSKKTSVKYLHAAGVLTERGEISRTYKKLCTPPDRG